MTTAPKIPRPSSDAIAAMPAFESLPPERIVLLTHADQCALAAAAIAAAGVVGFDTESKPLFRSDARQTGPHVLQLATRDMAFIVQIDQYTPTDFLRQILESDSILKVGFGLNNDHGPLRAKLNIALRHRLDLGPLFRKLGYKDAVGVKAAVAIVLGLRLRKSKKATTSNWAASTLSSSQLIYAADDAHAALLVFNELIRTGRLQFPPACETDHPR
ncbi:MAG: 3'-5' exonuclease domain-containing protein 2 [Rhodocyclaceae bacterium]|nr:3'-5' exonuclease domain-containing protein 2 [Rhodocyclaceae bacterium]MBK6909162.1 3'-5' exonuclease domain-containing protein 2 [Rhodocyclaceae bacterium]